MHKAFGVNKSHEKDPSVEVADAIALYLGKKEKYRVFMDENPGLYATFRTAFKRNRVTARISQIKSKNDSLIQVADYFAGLASEK